MKTSFYKLFGFGLMLSLGIAACGKSEGDKTGGNQDAKADTVSSQSGDAKAGKETHSESGDSKTKESGTTKEGTNSAESGIVFAETSHNFGKVVSGEKVKYSFKFTNKTKGDVRIRDVKPSCGCTASDYTKGAVKPGQSGFATLEFDSAGKEGVQSKTADVFFEGKDEPVKLTFKAEVVKK
jgi:hypothetical protein